MWCVVEFADQIAIRTVYLGFNSKEEADKFCVGFFYREVHQYQYK